MPAITARVRNMGRLQGKVKGLPDQIKAGALDGLKDIAPRIEDDLKNSIMTGSRSGRIVRRYRPSRVVQASAPGEFPANDTGQLVNSIEADVDPAQVNLTLGASAHHASYLENGTRKMLPRPFLRPTIDKWRKQIVKAIQDGIKRRV